MAKGMANKSGCRTDWQTHCKLRNHVTKLNNNNKKLHNETNINDIMNDSKKLWSTLNSLFFQIRHDMPATNTDTTHPSISDQIMKDKHSHFEFSIVSV